jgi:hypothetical protein
MNHRDKKEGKSFGKGICQIGQLQAGGSKGNLKPGIRDEMEREERGALWSWKNGHFKAAYNFLSCKR